MLVLWSVAAAAVSSLMFPSTLFAHWPPDRSEASHRGHIHSMLMNAAPPPPPCPFSENIYLCASNAYNTHTFTSSATRNYTIPFSVICVYTLVRVRASYSDAFRYAETGIADKLEHVSYTRRAYTILEHHRTYSSISLICTYIYVCYMLCIYAISPTINIASFWLCWCSRPPTKSSNIFSYIYTSDTHNILI